MNDKKSDYAEFNKALDILMNGTPFDEASVPAQASAYENSGKGSITVQVSTANGALPVENAKVTISGADGVLIYEQMTDMSGKTDAVALAAPSFEYSQEPENIRPYGTYNIKVEKNGYYTAEFLNVAVFDRIESVQPAILEPLRGSDTEEDIRRIDEKENELWQ